MKVIALETWKGLLTKDNIYDVVKFTKADFSENDRYSIIDDTNTINEYFSKRFIGLSDYREQQINSILDDKEN